MNTNSKLILTLLITIPTIFAAVNDKCTGRMVFVSILLPVVNLVVLLSLENVHPIQMILNVVIIFLVQLMMEEKEIVYFLLNVVVTKLVENVQEVMISNVVLVPQ